MPPHCSDADTLFLSRDLSPSARTAMPMMYVPCLLNTLIFSLLLGTYLHLHGTRSHRSEAFRCQQEIISMTTIPSFLTKPHWVTTVSTAPLSPLLSLITQLFDQSHCHCNILMPYLKHKSGRQRSLWRRTRSHYRTFIFFIICLLLRALLLSYCCISTHT